MTIDDIRINIDNIYTPLMIADSRLRVSEKSANFEAYGVSFRKNASLTNYFSKKSIEKLKNISDSEAVLIEYNHFVVHTFIALKKEGAYICIFASLYLMLEKRINFLKNSSCDYVKNHYIHMFNDGSINEAAVLVSPERYRKKYNSFCDKLTKCHTFDNIFLTNKKEERCLTSDIQISLDIIKGVLGTYSSIVKTSFDCIYDFYSVYDIYDLALILGGTTAFALKFRSEGNISYHVYSSPTELCIQISFIQSLTKEQESFLDDYIKAPEKYIDSIEAEAMYGLYLLKEVCNFIGCMFEYVLTPIDNNPVLIIKIPGHETTRSTLRCAFDEEFSIKTISNAFGLMINRLSGKV